MSQLEEPLSPLFYPENRHKTFTDNEGRSLSAGDFIRVTCEPKSQKFKIRHLFRTTNGTCWIDAYGPYDKYGNIWTNRTGKAPKYRSFRVDQVAAKCRS